MDTSGSLISLPYINSLEACIRIYEVVSKCFYQLRNGSGQRDHNWFNMKRPDVLKSDVK